MEIGLNTVPSGNQTRGRCVAVHYITATPCQIRRYITYIKNMHETKYQVKLCREITVTTKRDSYMKNMHGTKYQVQLGRKLTGTTKRDSYIKVVGWLCLASHRQRCHLETAPPFIVPCEGRECFNTVTNGNQTPGRCVAVHYITTAPRQLRPYIKNMHETKYQVQLGREVAVTITKDVQRKIHIWTICMKLTVN